MGYIANVPGERGPDSNQNSYSEFLKAFQVYIANPSEENYALLENQIDKTLNDPKVNLTVKKIIKTLHETLKKSHSYISKHKDKVLDLEKELRNKTTPEEKNKFEEQLNQAKRAYSKAKEKVQEELSKLKSLLNS